jgi:hypothetical protein
LSVFLDDPSIPTGSPINFLFTEMRALHQHHLGLALKLEEQILPPVVDCFTSLSRKQKILTQTVQSATGSARLLERQVYFAKTQAEKAELESLQHSPTKHDRPRRSQKSNERQLIVRTNKTVFFRN